MIPSDVRTQLFPELLVEAVSQPDNPYGYYQAIERRRQNRLAEARLLDLLASQEIERLYNLRDSNGDRRYRLKNIAKALGLTISQVSHAKRAADPASFLTAIKEEVSRLRRQADDTNAPSIARMWARARAAQIMAVARKLGQQAATQGVATISGLVTQGRGPQSAQRPLSKTG
ncbi:hypothetical protein [Nonomuraea basaltis]|uniref:hypothetical protein n=1 Tax=Nonomuraea basaltis TaxID=2495887 RepID=UPI00110C53F9|nr:hypothetical protein [Nonomuraea basaltis]TMR92560.1 hypothetical protein EJK15_43950 [Nonomuraea basaltis]